MHGDEREAQALVRQAREHAGAGLATFHEMAQYLDQHHFEQSIEHGLAAAVARGGLGEQQPERGPAALQSGQWQAHAGWQRRGDRVGGTAFEIQVRAYQIRAALLAGDEAMRHGPRIEQQARLRDVQGRGSTMTHFHLARADEMQLAVRAIVFPPG